jgi:uncharacterized protein
MAREAISPAMSANRKVVESYLATRDRSKIGPLLADDVEWIEWGDGVPSTGARTKGRTAFIQNFGTDELTSEIHRVTEENNVVVVEGTAHVHKKDGKELSVRFVDIFEVEDGKVKRLNSFGALVKDAA